MRRPAAVALALALGGAAIASVPAAGRSAAAPHPRVSVMIVGPHGVTFAPHRVRARPTRVRAGHRRCSVAGATGLAALVGARRAGAPALKVRADAACSAGQLFVTKIGAFRNHGAQGWSYKVGRVAPSVGAGKPTGVHRGSRVLWFWCRLGPGGCQRTLATSVTDDTVAPGGAVHVTVRAYDDRGHGKRSAGALVRLGSDRARTNADGQAILHAPGRPGGYRVSAASAGVVPAFPERVRVR